MAHSLDTSQKDRLTNHMTATYDHRFVTMSYLGLYWYVVGTTCHRQAIC